MKKTHSDSSNKYHLKLTDILFFTMLTILGISAILSLRWVSLTVHLNTGFGGNRELTITTALGFPILLLFLFTYTRKKVIHNINKIILSGLTLLLIGLVISTYLAGDKTLAIYTGSGLVLTLTLLFTAKTLTNAPWKLNLAIIFITALGTTFALKVWIKELYEIDMTWKHYIEHKEEFWAKQGKSLDDPAVRLFEARLKSRDNGGFFFHGNLGGAYLATVLMVSLALVGKRWHQRQEKFGWCWLILQLIISAFILSALILTQSKGAIIAIALASFILFFIWYFRNWLINHFRLAMALTLILLFLITSAVITYGLTKNELPTLSMKYRWQYWVASAKMFKDHPLGIGPGNFGHYYLQYKLPQAEEEVNSPHNFIVQSFCEFGFIGGIGMLILICGIIYSLTQPISHHHSPHNPTKYDQPPDAVKTLLTLTMLLFGIIFIINQTNLPGFIYLLAEYLPYILTFIFTLIICTFKADRIEKIENTLTENTEKYFLSGAILTFILSNLVNFSLFEPSTQILFFTLAGITLSTIESSPTPKSSLHKSAIIKLTTILIFLICYSHYIFTPAYKGETAYEEKKISKELAYAKFLNLTNSYPYDPYFPANAGRILIEQANRQPPPQAIKTISQAIELLKEATHRAEAIWKFYADIGQCYLILAELDNTQKLTYLTKAENYLEQAYKRAKMSKNLSKTLGLVYYRHIRELPQNPPENLIIKATKYIKRALELNSSLPPNSLHRFSDRDSSFLRSALEYLNHLEKQNLHQNLR